MYLRCVRPQFTTFFLGDVSTRMAEVRVRPGWVRCVAAVFALCVAARGVIGDTYYVHAERGNDAWSAADARQPDKPWRTLGRVARQLSDGDTVYGAGTFDD